MQCSGNQQDHCCYIDGEPCKYLEFNTMPDRRWVCGLRRELGNWEAVMEDERYQRDVQPHWSGGMTCQNWPDPALGHWCNNCKKGVPPPS